MVKLLCTQTILQEQPNDYYYRQHYKFSEKYLTMKEERNITSSAIRGSVAEAGCLNCVNKPLTFFFTDCRKLTSCSCDSPPENVS